MTLLPLITSYLSMRKKEEEKIPMAPNIIVVKKNPQIDQKLQENRILNRSEKVEMRKKGQAIIHNVFLLAREIKKNDKLKLKELADDEILIEKSFNTLRNRPEYLLGKKEAIEALKLYQDKVEKYSPAYNIAEKIIEILREEMKDELETLEE